MAAQSGQQRQQGQQKDIAGYLGSDLPEPVRLAYQEGHDADVPSNEGVLEPPSIGNLYQTLSSSARKEVELENGEPLDKSETTSLDGSHIQHGEASIEKPHLTSNTGEQVDPNIVFWDGDDDPANPLNWSTGLKWGNIAVLSAMTFLTPLASSMFAPGVPDVMREFHSDSNLIATFVVSIYVLGFAFGPLVCAPLSELYGRLYVYHVCNVGFLAFTIACAVAPSMGSLIAFRFFAGVIGVAPVTIGGGTIADLMPPARRGGAMAIWAMGPLLGPVVGPVGGGFLSQAKGWR